MQAADLKQAYDQAFERLVIGRQAAIGPLWDLLAALNAQARALEQAATFCAAQAWSGPASPTMVPAPRIQDNS